MQQSFRLMCSDGVMSEDIGCDRILLICQRFKRWVNTILDITSFYWFSLDTLHFWGAVLQSLTWSHQIIFPHSQLKFSASFSEDYAWMIFGNIPLLLLDIFITNIRWFTIIFIIIWFVLYKPPHDIFSWWVDWIISGRPSWMQKYSWSNKEPSGFSGL